MGEPLISPTLRAVHLAAAVQPLSTAIMAGHALALGQAFPSTPPPSAATSPRMEKYYFKYA
jgi:hypothetical protein